MTTYLPLVPANLATDAQAAAASAQADAAQAAIDASAASASAATAIAYAGWASAVPPLIAYDAALDANVLTYILPVNIYGDPALPDVSGEFISSVVGPTQGNIGSTATPGWARSAYIPITAGQQYTISANTGLNCGASFFATNSTTTCIAGTYVGSYIDGGPTGLTLTTGVAPVGANYLVLTVSTNIQPKPTQLMVQQGTTATAYQAWFAPIPQVLLSSITPAAAADADVVALQAFEADLNANVLTYQDSINLFDVSAIVPTKYINAVAGATQGNILTTGIAGWATSAYIPVTPGQQYTISTNTALNTAYAFFPAAMGTNCIKDSGGNGIYGSASLSSSAPLTTVVAPSVAAGDSADAAYIVFTASSSAYPTPPTELQLQLGTSALPYEAYYVNKPFVLAAAVTPPITVPDYEVTFTSKNLFNSATVRTNFFLSAVAGFEGQINSATGWICSAFIPVTPGQYYTISGSRGYSAQCFYTTNSNTANITSSYSNTSSPVTVKAPAIADGDPADGNYLAIQLQSAASTGYSNIQVELGQTATSYTPLYGSVVGVDTEYLYPPLSNTPNLNSAYVVLSSSTGYGSSAIVRSVDGVTLVNTISPFLPYVHYTSTVFNFYADSFSGGAGPQGTFRNCSDDAAPLHAFNQTLGANHGYSGSVCTVSAGHGKTWQDVGSKYTDGVHNFVIVSIISTTQLMVTSETGLYFVSGLNLTYVPGSGGNNTANMTLTSTATDDFFPAFKNRTFQISIDNVLITDYDNTYYYSDNATFSESYELMTKDSIVAWIVLHQPDFLSGAYDASTQWDGTAVMSISNNYVFDAVSGCTIQTDVLVLDTAAPNPEVNPFNDIMATQAGVCNAMGGTIRYYIPNALPYTFNMTTPLITGLVNAVCNGTQAVIYYTGTKVFTPGDLITIAGSGTGTLNVTGAEITSIGSGNFSINNTTPAGTYSLAGATLGVYFNFGSLYDMTGYIAYPPSASSYQEITPARSEIAPAWLPNRMVMMNDDYGMAVGYLPIQSSDPTTRRTIVTRSAIEMSPLAKIYPHLVDSAAIPSLNAGAFYSTICYRNWFVRSAVRTDAYMVQSPNGDYLFMDWHNTNVVDRYELPPQLQGRNFTTETSRNATLLTPYATNTITVNVTCSGDYAFLVLKFS